MHTQKIKSMLINPLINPRSDSYSERLTLWARRSVNTELSVCQTSV